MGKRERDEGAEVAAPKKKDGDEGEGAKREEAAIAAAKQMAGLEITEKGHTAQSA